MPQLTTVTKENNISLCGAVTLAEVRALLSEWLDSTGGPFYFFSIAFLFCILFASFLQYEWHIIKRVFSNQKAHRLFWQKCSPLKSLKKEKHILFTTYCFLLLSDPQDQDIEELVKYLGQLVLDSDLEMVDLILKFLHRWVFSKTCSKRFGVLFLIFFLCSL